MQDIAHGQIKLHPIVRKIIDTPQFQRLRNIKQLGLTSYVYMSAVHTRFEHSIGTAYLTYKLIKSLRQSNKNGDVITKQEELCLVIAGLCHDLGHGPFSHVFERIAPENWSHENMSIVMFDYLIKNNSNVYDKFCEYGLTEYHINLIKCMIIGFCNESDIPNIFINGTLYKKYFLFEIVCNHEHGIDTDKMDYLTRDSRMLGVECRFNYRRLINNMCIFSKINGLYICFKDKILLDCNELFHSRWLLHQNVYSHKTVVAIELMLCKALQLCGTLLDLKSSLHDPEVFQTLTDEILSFILMSNDPRSIESKQIIHKIMKRQLYKFAGRYLIPPGPAFSNNSIQLELIDGLRSFLSEKLSEHFISVLEMDVIECGYKKGSIVNPLERISFIDKRNKIHQGDHSKLFNLIPKICSEKYVS
ncbi:hypothetical protein HZS_2437, partial [Henneguya salminicola]